MKSSDAGELTRFPDGPRSDDAKSGLDARDLLRLLPHRWPVVLLDRVTELVPGERAVGLKCVTQNEPWALGHFPGNPVLPASVLLESMAQLAGLLGNLAEGTPAFVVGVDRARFRRPMVPGDRVELKACLVARSGKLFRVRVDCEVDGHRTASAELTLVGEEPRTDSDAP